MASQSDAEILGLYRAAAYFGLKCCIVSTITFVVYDWVVTLSREVDLFWTSQVRPLSAILYFSNKYLNMLSYIVNAVQMAPMSNQSCIKTTIVFRLFLYLSYIPPAAFTAMRAYALTRCRWLSAFVFLLSGVQFVTNMVAFIKYRVYGVYSPLWGCIGGVAVPLLSPLGETAFIVNRASTILADTILVVVTWRFLPAPGIKAYNSSAEGRKPKGLVATMLCNGITYFIVLSMLNILQLVVTVAFTVVADGLVIDVSYLTAPVSSVLVSHFLLDLQEAHQRTVAGLAACDPSDTSLSIGSSVVFADAVGPVDTIGSAAGHVQEGEGVSASHQSVTAEVIHPNGGEIIHLSRAEDGFAIAGVLKTG